MRAFLTFARDREALSAYLDRIGMIGPFMLASLLAIQVLIPTLPSEPPMIAGAYAYGFAIGFLISWLVMVAGTQLVFWLARWAGRPLAERLVPVNLLDKWTRIAGDKGTLFFMLAFVIPPVPSDLMVYVAGLSRIDGRRFFAANLIGRMPLVVLYSLIGARGFSITPAFLIWLSVIGVILLALWWYFIVRERPEGLSLA